MALSISILIHPINKDKQNRNYHSKIESQNNEYLQIPLWSNSFKMNNDTNTEIETLYQKLQIFTKP